MTKIIERLKNTIEKMEYASENNRLMLPDKVDIKTLYFILTELESKNSKISKLEKIAGITESEADLVQIPNKNTDLVYCNAKTFGFDVGSQYEVVKINKKQGNFTLVDNNGNKETFSLIAIINESFSVSKKTK
ncbi:TPA_asm: hypothetical protein GEU45_05900 [Listeria monocytogenes]|nr:hypothetical protein [Listeria monocytogenes]